jgi:hypothetical protein
MVFYDDKLVVAQLVKKSVSYGSRVLKSRLLVHILRQEFETCRVLAARPGYADVVFLVFLEPFQTDARTQYLTAVPLRSLQLQCTGTSDGM